MAAMQVWRVEREKNMDGQEKREKKAGTQRAV
jgi:hypothetical protein